MFLFVMDIILVIFQIFVMQAAGEYYKSKETSKWQDAVGKCNMAIPDIKVTPKGYVADIDYKLNYGEVWIGYFMKMTVFEYIGCAKIDKQQQQGINLTLQHNSPGLCYTTCRGKEFIGVSIDKCICLDSVGDPLQPYCNMSCDLRSGGVACGGQGYMSVYKVNKNESKGYRDKACLSFEHSSQRLFKWDTCSNYYLILCDNGTVTNQNGQTNQPWKEAVSVCIQKHLRPTSYQALRLTPEKMPPSWSGVISSDVIYTYNDTDWISSYTGILFGYMSANKSVHFAVSDAENFILCYRNAAERSTASSTLPTMVTGDSSIMSSLGTSFTDGTNTNKQGQDVGVVVGVSVTVIVVVAGVVTALVFLRRRRKLPDLCKGVKKRTVTDYTDDQGKTFHDKTVLPSKTNTEHSAAVHSKREENNVADETNDSNYSHTYMELEPHTNVNAANEVTGDGEGEVEERDYVYNKLKSENYTTYDHAYNTKKDYDTDNDYDTTEQAAMKMKARVEKLRDDYSEIETYSHIKRKPLSNSDIDNTYNIPSQYLCSGNTRETFAKEDRDEKGTYSHINSTPVSRNKPDNAYGIPDNVNVSNI